MLDQLSIMKEYTLKIKPRVVKVFTPEVKWEEFSKVASWLA